MVMYIPEFWCGVGATIITEIVVMIVIAVFTSFKEKGGKKDE